MLFISLTKGPGSLSNIFLITHKFPTLVQIDGPTLSIKKIFVFGFDQYITLLYHNYIMLRINMAVKCEVLMNCRKNIVDICKKQM